MKQHQKHRENQETHHGNRKGKPGGQKGTERGVTKATKKNDQKICKNRRGPEILIFPAPGLVFYREGEIVLGG